MKTHLHLNAFVLHSKKNTTNVFFIFIFLFSISAWSQTTLNIFDEVLYYDGYAGLVPEEDLYEPMPPDVLRHSNSRYAKKLTPAILNEIGNTLELEVNLKAACDNYDRLAHIFLAFVQPGATTYDTSDPNIPKVEIARFITPFMNKNISPDNLFYNFRTNNVAEILTNTSLLAEYDIWVEFEVFGVPYAAQDQVPGCAGRIDTFYGTLNFITDTDSSISYDDDMTFVPLAAKLNMNNYNDTDVPDETTRIIDFELDTPVEDAKLFLITSNHGANSGGEEYNRRWHYIYLNDELIHEYIPGGRSCEPFRQYNTQGNGIFGASPRSTRMWLDFNNWCPGDVIPIREIELGDLPAGEHTFKIDVPDAVFTNDEGYIPVSVYLQNRVSGNDVCVPPTEVDAEALSDSELSVDWIEEGTADQWEILYGPSGNINIEYIVDANNNGETGGVITDLAPLTWYQIYARSVCGTDFDSTWAGPIIARTNQLSIDENTKETFIYFPNPVKDVFVIKSNSLPIDRIQVFGVNGQMYRDIQPNKTIENLNLSDLPSGVYFANVQISGGSKTVKIVKQ
mgnify:CR=1 FL=1